MVKEQSMDDLVAFLFERIKDDERTARNRLEHWAGGSIIAITDTGIRLDDSAGSTAMQAGDQRMLAECRAKRAIVVKYWYELNVMARGHTSDWALGGQDARETALRCIAAVYEDHSGYRPEWKL